MYITFPVIRRVYDRTTKAYLYGSLLMHRNSSSSLKCCSLRNADLAQTFKQFVRTHSHSYRRKRLARRYLTKIQAIKCHVLHAISLSLFLSLMFTPHRPPSTNSVAFSRRHRLKMQPPDCISRYDRIISGKRRLKRLPAARLHRKTGVIPDYNVTAVSWRFTIRFDRQSDCYLRSSPRYPPLSSP